MSLATCLKDLRSQRGWTQGDLHRKTGLERSYLSRLESGKVHDLSLKNAILICRAFGITVEEFVATCFGNKGPGHSPGQTHRAGVTAL